MDHHLLNRYQRTSVAVTLSGVETALHEILHELRIAEDGILYKRA